MQNRENAWGGGSLQLKNRPHQAATFKQILEERESCVYQERRVFWAKQTASVKPLRQSVPEMFQKQEAPMTEEIRWCEAFGGVQAEE